MTNQADESQEFAVRATVHPLDARTVPVLRVERTVIDAMIWLELITGRDRVLLSNAQARALRECLDTILGSAHSDSKLRRAIKGSWWKVR